MYYKLESLSSKTTAEVTKELTAIPQNGTGLILRWNDLYKKSDADLAEILAAIPRSVIILDLSRNGLGDKSATELAQALEAIPKSVIYLNLNENNLRSKTGVGLAKIFAAIPQSVTTLDLSGNFLNKLSHSDLVQLQGTLQHVRTVYLSQDEIEDMPLGQRHALGAAFPNVENVIILDFERKPVDGNNPRLEIIKA